MKVVYPRKFQNTLSMRDFLKQVVSDRSIHLMTLNQYRYTEQRACKDLTQLMERLNGKPPELIINLCHHISDEGRHAVWLTDLLLDLGADVGKPPSYPYIDEFERLLDKHNYNLQSDLDDFLIAALAAINVGEKRGCGLYSAHLYALKFAPQTEENIRIRSIIEKILPEDAEHVRWSNRALAQLADKSPENRQKVEQAKRKYAAIEQAAFESGLDITLGAELRRVANLVQIANTMPLWSRPQYIMERLPETLLAPQLQLTRIQAAQIAWQRDPQTFMEKFVPMFINGVQKKN